MSRTLTLAAAAAATAVLAVTAVSCTDYTTVEPKPRVTTTREGVAVLEGPVVNTVTTTVTSPAPMPDALERQSVWEQEATLRDGRVVLCLSSQAGLSCDWGTPNV